IELLLADAALLEKYAMPLHLLLGQSYARPNALALGDQLGIVDLEQKLPGLHVRALMEEHGRHLPRCLRRKLHLLIGAERTGGKHALLQALRRRHMRRHAERPLAALCRGGPAAALEVQLRPRQGGYNNYEDAADQRAFYDG